MFRPLLCGMILGVLCRGYLEAPWVWALLAPLPILPLAARRRRLGLTPVVFMTLGLGLSLLRYPAPAEPGRFVELHGRWQATQERKGPVFVGSMRGAVRLRLRGLGSSMPAPGSRFTGLGLALPAGDPGMREIRLLRWQSDRGQEAGSWASLRTRRHWRQRFAARFTAPYPEKLRPLVQALLLGERTQIDWEQNRCYRNSGLAHLLAISGMNLALFLLLLRRLLGAIRLPPARAEILLLSLLPALPWLFGGEASINRAVMMAAYVLLHRRLGGRPRPAEALAGAACCEMALHPDSFFQAGFQLSYLATLALVAFFARGAARPRQRRGKALSWLGQGLAATMICTLSGLPVSLGLFDRLPVLGPIWNLAAGPLCTLALFLGWLSLPAAWLPGAELWLRPAATAFALLNGLALWAGGPAALSFSGFQIRAAFWGLWGLGFACLIWQGRRRLAISMLLMLMPALLGGASLHS